MQILDDAIWGPFPCQHLGHELIQMLSNTSDTGEEVCSVCTASMRPVFNGRILQQHDVTYFQCPQCDFLRTETPHWLEAAYASAIARTDTGLVLRNQHISRSLTCVLDAFFDSNARYLDTAGGTGLLTRLMRDIGFDFAWEDPYCDNLMAPGFEASPRETDFEAVTAFEAIEHMIDPMAFVQQSVARSRTRTLIFSTELYSDPLPPPDWWYLAQATGQHISFFTRRTMEAMAERCGLAFYSQGMLHMMTAQPVDARQYRRVMRRVERGQFEKVADRMTSLTQADHDRMLQDAADSARAG